LSIHRNAALSLRQRERLVVAVAAGATITAAAFRCGCSRQTASKWVGRFRAGDGLEDRSSRPHRSPRRCSALVERLVLAERARSRKGPHPIGWQLRLPPSTVHAILKRHGRSRLKQQTSEPVHRYERERPGELLHIDSKQLGRIKRPRDPQTGRLHGTAGRAGWDHLFVCVDDHTRLAHAALYPAETTANALAFLDDCRRFYAQHGITIERVLTDNGKCFQRHWEHACRQRAITPKHTRPRRPQTNGKAERFIQTLLRECVHATLYRSDHHRASALSHYLHHYNTTRRHRALKGLTPQQRASTTSLGRTTRFELLGVRTENRSAPIWFARESDWVCRSRPVRSETTAWFGLRRTRFGF
jgi:transposase InsO family protein